MPCLAAPKIPSLDAAISILLPDLSFSPPTLGVEFCCAVETPPIPGFPIILPIGSLPIPGVALIVSTAMTIINTAIDQLNELLDQLQVECPLE